MELVLHQTDPDDLKDVFGDRVEAPLELESGYRTSIYIEAAFSLEDRRAIFRERQSPLISTFLRESRDSGFAISARLLCV